MSYLQAMQAKLGRLGNLTRQETSKILYFVQKATLLKLFPFHINETS